MPAPRSIPAADTRPLRHAILRPNQPVEACVYPGDEAPGSFHLGIRGVSENHEPGLVAIASFYREQGPGGPASNTNLPSTDLRIRGMAVVPECRGRGLGRTLVDAGLALAREQATPPSLVWCNARTTAAAYYAKLGFTPRGDEFELEGIGPHFVMIRDL